MASPTTSLTTMGERIAWARERARLNKNQFARELGTSWQHVDHWERGRTEPSLASIRRIGEILGVSVDFLLGVRDDPALPSPAAPTVSPLERFLRELAPADLSEDEAEWLRRAPVDARQAAPEDYLALLENVRRIGRSPAAPKSGRRRKVEPASLEAALRRKGGSAA